MKSCTIPGYQSAVKAITMPSGESAVTSAQSFSTANLQLLLQLMKFPAYHQLISDLLSGNNKKSFLVTKDNKYRSVLTHDIALFFIAGETPLIQCFDAAVFPLHQPLEVIQRRLPEQQFFRINRQCLINFKLVKDVEAYFGRKLLINPVIPVPQPLVVPREKVAAFLEWLDNR